MRVPIGITSDRIIRDYSVARPGLYCGYPGPHVLVWSGPERAVRNGEADAVLADRDFLVPLVEESNGALMFVGEEVPLGGGIGLGLRESDTELKDKFDAAITSMKEDGTLNDLLKKWFGEDTQTY